MDAWNNNNMKTLKDFLEWYNNLDVILFVEAIEKMNVFYKNKKLDLFKFQKWCKFTRLSIKIFN